MRRDRFQHNSSLMTLVFDVKKQTNKQERKKEEEQMKTKLE